MIWIALIMAALSAAVFVWWMFVLTRPTAHPFFWRAVWTMALTLGFLPGYWYGFGLRYRVHPTFEMQGFPIPFAFFMFDEERWIEYGGPRYLGALNVVLIISIIPLPFALAMCRRRFNGLSNDSSRRIQEPTEGRR